MPTSANILAATRLAATLSEQAELIRARAAQVGAAGAAVRWRSFASTLFHHKLEQAIPELLHCATEFEHAAQAILALAVVA
jgi:hypothetical protein